MFEFGSIKGRSRKNLRPEIFQARTPVEDLTMFEDQQAIAICFFFWLTRKRWGEQQEFSRWKNELYKVFKKGLAGENELLFFFKASSSLFVEALNQRWSSQMCCFSDLVNYSLKELDGMG